MYSPLQSIATSWIDYILANQDQFLGLLADHIRMVGIGEIIAILIAVPAGILATRDPRAARIIESLGATAQTIPALGVVALTFTFLGLGQRPTILAIVIYAVFPILKNTVAGIQQVDDSMVRAGRGMGMTNLQRLKQLEARPPGSAEFVARQDSLQPPEDSTDVLSVIEGVLEAEEGAIATYRELIEAAEAANDPVTEDLAVTILSDEEAHRTEFRGFRKEYRSD